MASTARVLILGDASGGQDNGISAALSKNGFYSENVDIASGIEACSHGARPDVVVLDLHAKNAPAHIEQFVAFAKFIKSDATLTHIPVVAVGEESTCAEVDLAEIRNARVDEIILGPINEYQICGRLNALARLNTMHEELVRRLNTSAKYGVDAPNIKAPTQKGG